MDLKNKTMRYMLWTMRWVSEGLVDKLKNVNNLTHTGKLKKAKDLVNRD